MIVVSDASPLIALGAIDHLGLLRDLYGQVLIPPSVMSEVTEARPEAPGAAAVKALSWLEVAPVENPTLVAGLAGDGELPSEPALLLLLGLEKGPSRTVADDRADALALGLSEVSLSAST